MLEYEKRYKTLNSAQKQAVDHIDGPMMVIAGPGTGKTELLSMRAANILQKSDMNPGNILCLTYTESGVRAMRERLINLIGQDAYKVAIQTFHGFGSEIISNNPDYFYSGADFRPADELSTYEILHNIFTKLPHDNPLSAKLNDEFSYMNKVQSSISDFKRAGLTPDEIQRLAHHSLGFIEFAEPKIRDFWPSKIDKKIIAQMESLITKLEKYDSEPTNVPNTVPLSDICIEQLKSASATASETGKTNAITNWKSQWLEKDSDGAFVFRDRKLLQQLNAASSIYQDYLSAMQSAKLYDYDDMILRVVHALEIFHDLRLNLQEKYQYIMVDEFQDTNGAQMRILQSLIDIPTGDSPNIMVVGDDDQAIYSFQGAEISNILGFEKLLQKPRIVTLKQNYRSPESVLSDSRNVITQGEDRLENQLETIDKTLTAQQKSTNHAVDYIAYSSQAAEFLSVAECIKQSIDKGTDPNDIVVLARGKKDILAFLPYLQHQKVKVSYEHDENILDSPPVEILLQLSQLVLNIHDGDIDAANALMPTVLSHKAFNIEPRQLYKLSLTAYKERQTWLEAMLETKGQLPSVADWLLRVSQLVPTTPVEHMIDMLFGSIVDSEFTSPLKDYFFSKEQLNSTPDDYLNHLQALATIRTNIREYKPQTQLRLKDFVEYVQLANSAGIRLKNHYEATVIDRAVRVMTAHKAKGLEFDSVYIINATSDTWGSKSRGYNSRLGYPENLAIGQAGDSYDDKLRLFFVAMTRAKEQLHISAADQNIAGKAMLKADFLADKDWKQKDDNKSAELLIQAAENTWQSHISPVSDHNLLELLSPLLQNYRLSATHLNNFIDVTSGGPQSFLLGNLLHFPQAISASAAMGSSVHKALQKAHQHLRVTNEKRPIEDVVGDFEYYLALCRLSQDDFNHQLQKGSDALRNYLENTYDQFTPEQEVEFDFSRQGSAVNDVRLTGIIDVMDIDHKLKKISVIDYKTGKPALSWQGKTDFEKIKLHKYKQQLMFYKLLIEQSRDFQDYSVDDLQLAFIEPSQTGALSNLNAEFNKDELGEFKKLLTAVWNSINNGEFIDTTQYDQNYKGILQFEKDLISK